MIGAFRVTKRIGMRFTVSVHTKYNTNINIVVKYSNDVW